MGKKNREEEQLKTEETPEVTVDSNDEVAEDNAEPGVDERVETVQAEEELCEEDRLRQKVTELGDKLLRTAADFENSKKRLARQYDDMVRSANDALIMELLEIVDNFERALNHSEDNTTLEAFKKGTELIFNQMRNLLTKYDVTPIEAVGQPFDPNLHDAMLQIDTDEYEEGIVAVEISKGYRQGDRVIRHSRVGVSTGKKRDE